MVTTVGRGQKRRHLKELEDKLAKERSSNLWAWDHYGSELCAAEMERREREIADKIKKLKEELGARR